MTWRVGAGFDRTRRGRLGHLFFILAGPHPREPHALRVPRRCSGRPEPVESRGGPRPCRLLRSRPTALNVARCESGCRGAWLTKRRREASNHPCALGQLCPLAYAGGAKAQGRRAQLAAYRRRHAAQAPECEDRRLPPGGRRDVELVRRLRRPKVIRLLLALQMGGPDFGRVYSERIPITRAILSELGAGLM
jgi:hypothetical protein